MSEQTRDVECPRRAARERPREPLVEHFGVCVVGALRGAILYDERIGQARRGATPQIWAGRRP